MLNDLQIYLQIRYLDNVCFMLTLPYIFQQLMDTIISQASPVMSRKGTIRMRKSNVTFIGVARDVAVSLPGVLNHVCPFNFLDVQCMSSNVCYLRLKYLQVSLLTREQLLSKVIQKTKLSNCSGNLSIIVTDI